jgi:hypothetical protein
VLLYACHNSWAGSSSGEHSTAKRLAKSCCYLVNIPHAGVVRPKKHVMHGALRHAGEFGDGGAVECPGLEDSPQAPKRQRAGSSVRLRRRFLSTRLRSTFMRCCAHLNRTHIRFHS